VEASLFYSRYSTDMNTKKTSRSFVSHKLSYIALRTTGLLLAVLALGHFVITHIVNDVAETDSSFVISRWSSIIWVVWDVLLLTSALIHAFAGLAIVVHDYSKNQKSRVRTLRLLSIFVMFLLITGLLVMAFSLYRIYGNGA
jgi:succinate dehydrogenase hydrophobic anchor subunit